jgi:TRAP transporter TAXI family solute receptor
MPSSLVRSLTLLFLLVLCSGPAAALQQDAGGGSTGIDVKRPVFGGACMLCPWGALAEVVRQAMQPYGYDVQICYNCNAAPSPLIVADRRPPPPYRPDPVVPGVLAPRNRPGLGPVDFGATAVQFMVGAYRGTGPYAQERPRTNLRLIGNIQSPNYLVVAARAETGITDLSQVRARRWPVKVLAGGSGGGQADMILSHFGLPRDSILAAGGRIGASLSDRDDFDIIIYASQGLTSAPEFAVWTDVSQRFRLNYMRLPDELAAKLAADDWYDPGLIPVGLLPGIEHPIPTVVRTGTVVYTRDDVPDSFAYDVARALDEQQHLLQWSQLNFSYNPHNVWKALEVPLHPGAARYYRERGYLKQ